MKLYLVRHGETDANRLLGHSVSGPMHNEPVTYTPGDDTNVVLNVYGRAQAQEAGTELPDTFDALYTSPLLRVKETAEIIAKMKEYDYSRVILRDELVEYRMGKFEGLTTEEKQKIAPEGWGSGSRCTYDYTPWGGDSWKTIYDRVSRLLDELKTTHAGQTIICVTSAGVIRMAYKIFFEEKAPGMTRHILIKNGSVHQFIL